MTSKERMLCAIEGRIPDRLPVTVHQWQPYHLKTYMNGMSDIEANKACGLDAVSYTHLICIHKHSVLGLDPQVVLRFHTKRIGRGGVD